MFQKLSSHGVTQQLIINPKVSRIRRMQFLIPLSRVKDGSIVVKKAGAVVHWRYSAATSLVKAVRNRLL